MRQGHIFSNDILLGQIEIETAGLSDIGSLAEECWRLDAAFTYPHSARGQSSRADEQPDWLSAERQEYGVEPEDEDPE